MFKIRGVNPSLDRTFKKIKKTLEKLLSLLAGRLFVVGRWAGCARHNFVGFKFKGF